MSLTLGGVGVHGGGAEHNDGDGRGEQGGVLLPGLHPGGADREGGEALHGAGMGGGGGAQPAQDVT